MGKKLIYLLLAFGLAALSCSSTTAPKITNVKLYDGPVNFSVCWTTNVPTQGQVTMCGGGMCIKSDKDDWDTLHFYVDGPKSDHITITAYGENKTETFMKVK